MSSPKVSIVVPVYKVEEYIDRCLDSLLNQTLKDIEIILVDDGSPDNCPKICDEYAQKDARVRVVHKQNEGLGYARNSGMEVAVGEYIAFVDSDDFVDIRMFEELYSTAKKSNSDIVLCGYKRIKKNKCIGQYHDVDVPELKHGKECLSILKGMIGETPEYRHYDFAVWHGIYKNDLIRRNNIKFCSEREYISEDVVFHLSIIPFCDKICILPDRFYNYCLNSNSLTTKYGSGRFQANMKLYSYIKQYTGDLGFICEDSFQKCLDYFVIDKAISSCSYEIRYNKNNCFGELKRIINDKAVQEAVGKYPFKILSCKQRVLLYLIRKRLSVIIFVLFKMKMIFE